MPEILQFLLSGITVGAVYALVALGFLDAVGNFARLALAQANGAAAVADHHDGREAETPAALDDGRGAVDPHDLFFADLNIPCRYSLCHACPSLAFGPF